MTVELSRFHKPKVCFYMLTMSSISDWGNNSNEKFTVPFQTNYEIWLIKKELSFELRFYNENVKTLAINHRRVSNRLPFPESQCKVWIQQTLGEQYVRWMKNNRWKYICWKSWIWIIYKLWTSSCWMKYEIGLWFIVKISESSCFSKHSLIFTKATKSTMLVKILMC